MATDASTAILWVWERAERTSVRESNSWTEFGRCCHHRFAFYLSKLSISTCQAVQSNLQRFIIDLLVKYEATSVREVRHVYIKQSSDGNSVPACLTV